MIEAFCREYLGGTLKTQSTKFFGSGAIDLDAYSKSHAELWELLSTDIEVSRIAAPGLSSPVTYGRSYGRIEVVHTRDIAQVTISPTENEGSTQSDGAVNEEEATGTEPAKLLRIVDDTGATGLQGYYLRIPESATSAFGDLIRTFDSFAVVWFANRVTWQGTDLKSTAFLFDVTLDRLIGDKATGAPAHGATELPSARIHNYNNQIYFYIPPEVQNYIVPTSEAEAVKIELTHELVDLGRARSWTSKQTKDAN